MYGVKIVEWWYCTFKIGEILDDVLKVHKIENFFGFDFEICTIFFVSYVKILRFYRKKILFVPLLEELRLFRGVLGLRRMKKIFEGGQKFFVGFFH